MPMIDVYAPEGTFPDSHTLARDLAAAVMRWEQVPDFPLFATNTAAFIHEMDEAAISNVSGESNYVRVQVLTPVGVLDRDTMEVSERHARTRAIIRATFVLQIGP